jgi:uncharacterized protein Yka (UPF0111/DUF47 family)
LDIVLTDKTQIIQELGNKELLLPKLVNEALAANDRIKYFLSLLQMAKSHADNLGHDFSSMKLERQASGITDSSFDSVVEASSRTDGHYSIPNAKRIIEGIKDDIWKMVAPLSVRATDKNYRSRIESLIGQIPPIENDSIPGQFINQAASIQKGIDSLHVVVMDLHKELNALQAAIYQESIEGASVYAVSEVSDRNLVKAFMKGVKDTMKLKFEHPGLGTTATKSGDTLVIQNDIGMTDAHVLVIHVRSKTASLTYTDVHPERLAFFQSLFSNFQVKWSDTTTKRNEKFEDNAYYLTVGHYEARDLEDLANYLTFLGSRIVFLIDWNRARKRLRNFAKKSDTITVLKWAADNNFGHMGFLKMGGENLIFDAIKKTPNTPLHYGQQFYKVLGNENTVEFLKFVLRTSAEGLLENRSDLLIVDEIRVELLKHFHTLYENLLEVTQDHATLIVELAAAVRDVVANIDAINQDSARELARVKRWEYAADNLLNEVRGMTKRSNAPAVFEELLMTADDAADALEEAVFHLSLVPRGERLGSFSEPLHGLVDLASRGSMEYLKAVSNARVLGRTSSRNEMNDFLESIDKILVIEHQADAVYRSLTRALLSETSNFKQLRIFSETSSQIEESIDDLMKAAIILRDMTLEDITR